MILQSSVALFKKTNFPSIFNFPELEGMFPNFPGNFPTFPGKFPDLRTLDKIKQKINF